MYKYIILKIMYLHVRPAQGLQLWTSLLRHIYRNVFDCVLSLTNKRSHMRGGRKQDYCTTFWLDESLPLCSSPAAIGHNCATGSPLATNEPWEKAVQQSSDWRNESSVQPDVHWVNSPVNDKHSYTGTPTHITIFNGQNIWRFKILPIGNCKEIVTVVEHCWVRHTVCNLLEPPVNQMDRIGSLCERID